MPRYPDSFIDELRERVDLLELASRHTTLKKSGVNWMGPCPFHRDKDPSFSVRPDKGFFKCFGCGKSGDVFAFVMATRGGGFNEAVEELAAQAGLPLPELRVHDDPHAQRVRAERERLAELLERAQRFYHDTLRGPMGRSALEYLLGRGLSPATLERFGVGYAPRGWATLVERFGGGTAAIDLLVKAGLAIRREGGGAGEGGGYDRFRDRVTFPIRDHRGRLVGFGGRVVGKGGEKEPKYINSPETPLYRKGEVLYGLDRAQEAIQKSGLVVVVEGYLDLIALANHGIEGVVATLGTALTAEHLALLWRRSKRVVFCFDGDAAGRKAAWRAVEQVMDGLQADRHVGFLFLPNGEDPDEAVRREGPEAFLRRLERAAPLLDVLLEGLGRDLDPTTPEGRAALVHRARPHLRKVADPVLRHLYAEAVERRLGLPAGQARELLSDAAPGRGGRGRPDRAGEVPAGGRGPLPPRGAGVPGGRAAMPRPGGSGLAGGIDYERILLQQILHQPALGRHHEEELGRLELDDPLLAELLSELLHLAHDPEGGDWPLERLPHPHLEALARRLLGEPLVIPLPAEGEGGGTGPATFDGCLLLCRRRHLERAIAGLMQQGAEAGLSDAASHELYDLQRRLADLHQQRRQQALSCSH